jgi:hypothetical protein
MLRLSAPIYRATTERLRRSGMAKKHATIPSRHQFTGAPDAINKMLVCSCDDFDFRDVWVRRWKFVT